MFTVHWFDYLLVKTKPSKESSFVVKRDDHTPKGHTLTAWSNLYCKVRFSNFLLFLLRNQESINSNLFGSYANLQFALRKGQFFKMSIGTGCINTDCRFCILNCSKVGLISRFLLSWNYSLGMRKLFNSATSLKIHKVLDWWSSEEKSYILVIFF